MEPGQQRKPVPLDYCSPSAEGRNTSGVRGFGPLVLSLLAALPLAGLWARMLSGSPPGRMDMMAIDPIMLVSLAAGAASFAWGLWSLRRPPTKPDVLVWAFAISALVIVVFFVLSIAIGRHLSDISRQMLS